MQYFTQTYIYIFNQYIKPIFNCTLNLFTNLNSSDYDFSFALYAYTQHLDSGKLCLPFFYYTMNSLPTVNSSLTKISHKNLLCPIMHKLNVAHPLKFNLGVQGADFKLFLFFHSSPEQFFFKLNQDFFHNQHTLAKISEWALVR